MRYLLNASTATRRPSISPNVSGRWLWKMTLRALREQGWDGKTPEQLLLRLIEPNAKTQTRRPAAVVHRLAHVQVVHRLDRIVLREHALEKRMRMW